MRRLLLPFFAVMFVAAIAISLWHTHPPTVGVKLLHALESGNGPLRSSLVLLDDTPDPVALSADRAQPVQRGHGNPPGEGLIPDFNQRWLKGSNFEFLWQTATDKSPLNDPLRAALGPESPAEREFAQALANAGYFSDAITSTLSAAARDLQSLSDENLFLAWLAADRAVLAESDNLPRAARQALLLLARENPGPAILFTVANTQVYLLPLDTSSFAHSATVWTQLEAYKNGHLLWLGTLSITGSPTPKRVREIAARAAEEPAKPLPAK